MLWLSLGENCLPDDILRRFYLKSFSTPFSHGRTNIDYAIAADLDDMAGVIDKSRLSKAKNGNQEVVKSSAYECDAGMFSPGVSQGFEITHHHVLDNEEHFHSYERKVKRWIDARNSGEAVIFLYYHRNFPGRNTGAIVPKIAQFQQSFGRAGASASVIILDEDVDADSRKMECAVISKTLIRAHAVTAKAWKGPDLWARHDNDLFRDMFDFCFEHFGIKPQHRLPYEGTASAALSA